jgi:hypothetical protein
MALFNKTKMSAPMGMMDRDKGKKNKPTPVDNSLPKTRKSLFGDKQITTSRSIDKKGTLLKSKRVLNPDGTSKTRTVEKKPGLKGVFGRRETTTTYRGANQDDVMTTQRIRKKGLLPKVKTTTTDQLMREKDVKKNFLYKLGSRGERKKMKGDIRGEGDRVTPKNCLKNCAAGIKK